MAYLGNTPTQQAFTPAIDYFSGNGSTVAFTLSRPVASVAQVQVNVNNVAQNPSTAFTVSGNTITFTGAPSSGTNNIYVQYTSPITQVIAPGQGTVAPASLSQGGPSWDTSGNVTLTGNIALNNGAADGAQLTLSSLGYSDWNWDNYSGRLRAYYGSTEYMTINTSGNVGIGTSSPATKLHLYGATVTAFVERTGSDSAGYRAKTTLGDFTWGVGIAAAANCWNVYDGTAGAERMRIDSSGNLLVGATSTFDNVSFLTTQCYGGVATKINTTVPTTQLSFFNPNGRVGWVGTSGTSTTYNTSSDYRLKENIAPMAGALSVVAALKPVTYTWKADGASGQGFIAHELQEVVPDCVTGEKDAVQTYIDEDGNEQTSPVYQGIDTSFLVATLTAAIQELKAIVDEQAAKITALENK